MAVGKRKGLDTEKLPILSRREIEDRIGRGQNLVIVNNQVLNCDPWLPYHPGGEKAIRHMVGRDATDEVTVLHSPEAKQRMLSYRIGRIDERWINFVPPIQGGIFREVGDICDEQSVESVSGISTPDLTRQRRLGQLTPPSSASSSASLDDGDEEKESQASLLDAQTQKELQIDLEKYPSLDPRTQDVIVEKYRQLGQKIEDEGLFQCNYYRYGVECIRYFILFATAMYSLHLGWYKTSALFLGLWWHQLTFLVHDAGHMGITHDYHIDTCIGIFVGDFLGGLSVGWWKRNHNVHHIVTNSPEHDPDIQHIPFFAVTHRFLESLKSTYYDHIMAYDPVAQVTIKIQHHLYYIILAFGRFNLYRLSWTYLLLRQAPRKGPSWWHYWLEVAANLAFWVWFGYGILYCSLPDNSTRLAYLLISHVVTSPVHVQITLSHFAMSTADLGPAESFPQKMLRTTMDVDCPEWLDWVHGGLQHQVVHHLFPRIPRHNLRRAQTLVREYCKQVDIPYAIYGWVEGNQEVLSRLEEVAKQARIMAECQKHMASTGNTGLH